MALRGHMEIPEATRERVKAKAEQMGYRPDPAMRALADYRTRSHSAARRWDRVALVHDWQSQKAWHIDGFYGSWHNRLNALANERGVEVEEHWLGANAEHAKTVFRSIYHRGISGLLIAPPALLRDPRAVHVPPGQFQVVTFGPEHLYPDFHTVQFDFFENIRLAWSELWKQGYRRIGLLLHKRQEWRTGHAWRAAHHVEQLIAGFPPDAMMPLVLSGEDVETDQAAYLDWLERDQYDAVISCVNRIEHWNRGIDQPPAVALWNVSRSGKQGIDINVDKLLRSAFELLYVEMQQSLVAHHDLPFRIHIPGKWVGHDRNGTRITVAVDEKCTPPPREQSIKAID